MEGAFLVHGLKRSREILVSFVQRLILLSRRPEKHLELIGIHSAESRIALIPLHLYVLAPVPKILERQFERSAFLQRHELSQSGCELRFAVRRETHDLELIAVVHEAEMLGDGGIEHPE